MKIKKGDNIIVIAGKDKGKEGKISRVLRGKNSVIVEGINIHKRHHRPRKQGQSGQIVEFASPVHISNVAIKDSKTGKPSRIGYRIEGGKKTRISKKSGSEI